LDLAGTLEAGRPVFEPGILSRADRGIAILSMAERTESIAAGLIGEALDTGRCGVSSSRFLLIALDEGAEADEGLCPRLADRTQLRIDLSQVSFREAEGAQLAPEIEHMSPSAASIPGAIL
ncbi:MAG TPA: magnesium chelatase ATPase subunit D, partial [Rhizobiaceae bacterium]|nr:magnesium chelatase ATPase subunit D [Rhizobiaceae bacterium]